MPKLPSWNPPKNMPRALEDADGIWETDRYAPIRLTAMSGTTYEGREIPIAWQIEFDPANAEVDAPNAANARLAAAGTAPDGYAWAELVLQTLHQTDPTLAARLHMTDTEEATCVIWVESEADCRALLETAWRLIFPSR